MFNLGDKLKHWQKALTFGRLCATISQLSEYYLNVVDFKKF